MIGTRRGATPYAPHRGHRSRLRFETLEDRRLLSVVPDGPEFQVNTDTTQYQRDASVAMDADGDYVVSWTRDVVSAPDQDDNESGVFAQRFIDTTPTTVTGRHTFYNNSGYDNNTPGINPADSSAIATDKSAYLPDAGTITPASMTSYSRGLNGIFVDLTGTHGTLGLGDFGFRTSDQGTEANNTPSIWSAAPAPIAFTVLADTPTVGTDRVEFIWADNAIQNQYLEVRVFGNDDAGSDNTNTGLASTDIFYFGSMVGDTFVDTPGAVFRTTAADEIEIQTRIISLATITSVWDMDRNGIHLASDRIVTRAHTITALNRLNILSSGSVYLVHADGSSSFFPAAADTDEARGTAFRSAATAAVAGETVQLGPGTFNIDATEAAIFLAAGVTIKGAGMDVTTIQSGLTGHQIEKAILVLNDNVTLEDFRFHGTAVDAYQRPIGSHSTSFQNAVLRRVKIYAPNASDALYDWGLGTSSYFLYDCDFRSGSSVIKMLSSGGGDTLYAENCYFEVLGDNYNGPEDYLVIVAFNKRATQTFKNCQFKARGEATIRTLGAMVWGEYDGVTILENCEFDVSATSGSVYDLDSAFLGTTGDAQFFVSGGHGSGPNGEYIVSIEDDVTYIDPDSASPTDDAGGSAVASALAIPELPEWRGNRLSITTGLSSVEPRGEPTASFVQHLGKANESRAKSNSTAVDDAVDASGLDDDFLDSLLDDLRLNKTSSGPLR